MKALAIIVGVALALMFVLMLRHGANTQAQTQVDTPTPTPTPVPTTVHTPTPMPIEFGMVSAGANHSCMLDDQGEIACQGVNDYGQVSDHPRGDGFTAVSVGARHSCAIDRYGEIRCWGSDEYEQSSPPSPPSDTEYIALGSGDNYTCSIRSDGESICWGRFESVVENISTSTTPTPTTTPDVTPTPTAVNISTPTPTATNTPTPSPTSTPTAVPTTPGVRVYTLRELASIEDDWDFSDPDIRLRVRGYVHLIGDDIGDLTLWIRDAGYKEYCKFDEAHRSAVTALTEGDVVTVDGTLNGFWLQDCELTTTDLSITPVPTPTPSATPSRVHTLRELDAIEDDWEFTDPDIRLRVRGYAHLIREDIGDLTLWLRDAGYREYCYFDEAYRPTVTALSEGEQVTVDGTFNGFWLRDCVIVSRSGQGTGNAAEPLSESEIKELLMQQEQDRRNLESRYQDRQ